MFSIRKSGIALALSSLMACTMSDNTVTDKTGNGLTVSITDSTTVTVQLKDLTKSTFSDTSSIDLADIRKQLKDKNIDLSSINITGLAVSYGDSSAKFLLANQDVKFVLKIYVKESSDSGIGKVALETSAMAPLAFSETQVVFQLQQQIFANPSGFPLVKSGIQDVTKSELKVRAELTLIDAMKVVGMLKVNFVATVSGKVQI